MACSCCDNAEDCCIHSATQPVADVNYPTYDLGSIPTVGDRVSVPAGACTHGFLVPGSDFVYRGTPRNNACPCDPDPPCLCCSQGQCFAIPCTPAGEAACVSAGGAVVANCEGCDSYDESQYGACCSQECFGFHCRRMTASQCEQNARAAGRRFSNFAGPGTECQEVSRCCVDGVVNPAIVSSAACTAASGTWVTGHACDEYPCGPPVCNCCCDEENPCPTLACECVDGQCEPVQFVYTCTTLYGCEAINPQAFPDGYPFPVYATLAECEENCRYRGVICNRYFGCQGPQYGPPSLPDVGPPSCSDCVPVWGCRGFSLCSFAGFRDRTNLPYYEYTSQAACLAACKAYCDPADGCRFKATGVSPADAFCPSCVPCDTCNPLP